MIALPSWSRPLAAVVLIAISSCSSPPGTPIPPRTPFEKMMWSEEFDGPAGASVDKSRWHHELGPWPFNKELETYTDSPDNIALDGNGNLVITARAEAKDGANYTSARIDTRDSFKTTYGRIEARMKLPAGQGLWPAFWMLGIDRADNGWPQCGEIDIMEFAGGSPHQIVGSLHGPGYSGGNPITKRLTTADRDYSAEFHVFAVEWEPQAVRWFVDDELYQTVGVDDVARRGAWRFDHPFYVILNLAVGGSFGGDPNSNTVFPQTLTVDWIRVWQH